MGPRKPLGQGRVLPGLNPGMYTVLTICDRIRFSASSFFLLQFPVAFFLLHHVFYGCSDFCFRRGFSFAFYCFDCYERHVDFGRQGGVPSERTCSLLMILCLRIFALGLSVRGVVASVWNLWRRDLWHVEWLKIQSSLNQDSSIFTWRVQMALVCANPALPSLSCHRIWGQVFALTKKRLRSGSSVSLVTSTRRMRLKCRIRRQLVICSRIQISLPSRRPRRIRFLILTDPLSPFLQNY